MPRFRSAVLAVISLFALGGCVDAELDVRVDEDGKVHGTVSFAVDKEFLNQELSVEDAVDEFFAGMVDDPTADLPGGAEPEFFETATLAGRRAALDGAPAAELSERYEAPFGLDLRREGDDWRLDLSLDLSEHEQLDDDIRSAMTVHVYMGFPGVVSETDGELSDDELAASWELDASEPQTGFAVAGASPPAERESAPAAESEAAAATEDAPGFDPVVLTWAGAVGGAALAMFLVALLWRRRRLRKREAAAEVVSAPPVAAADESVTAELPALPQPGAPVEPFRRDWK